MSRWISALRGLSFSLLTSRRERSRLARGSIEYSAVTQPVPSGTWRGAPGSTLAQQRTFVLPHEDIKDLQPFDAKAYVEALI